MQNPFNNPAFETATLTKAINLLPNSYGRLRELNLFPEKGVRDRTIVAEFKQGQLNLLPTKPVGSDGTKYINAKRHVRSFHIPHIPFDGEILPDEYQSIRAFGSGLS
ncbi:MAG: major capsid protein [Patescibacteria group bacterium]|nr:major capsid protein [Patescibacteria group bacterium]